MSVRYARFLIRTHSTPPILLWVAHAVETNLMAGSFHVLDVATVPERWRVGDRLPGPPLVHRERIRPGDYLLCYLTGVSRWIGLSEATSEG